MYSMTPMSPTYLWLTIAAMGLVTFLTRLSMIALIERAEMPVLLKRGLRYVPTAVLSAIVLPALVSPEGPLDLSLSNLRLLAGAAAALVAYFSRNVVMTIAVGMGALWLLQAYFG